MFADHPYPLFWIRYRKIYENWATCNEPCVVPEQREVSLDDERFLLLADVFDPHHVDVAHYRGVPRGIGLDCR